MDKHNHTGRGLTRREFMGGATAVAAYSVLPRHRIRQGGAKPDSNFGGVHIGAITYSWRGLPSTAEDLLGYLVQCGLSSVELMGGPAEQFAGAPVLKWTRPPRGTEMTDEQRAKLKKARAAHAEALRKWRLSVPMDRYEALRKKYNDAGVDIYIVKFGEIGDTAVSEAENDYFFRAAKALGARGITTEISEKKAELLGPMADRHRIKIGFHNHTQVHSGSWEKPFSYGAHLAMNFDVGHYVAGTNESPIPVIERYAEAGRILSLHLKDRKVNNGPNMPFGQGDTPLGLILQLMKRKKYTFPAHIELEYPIPEGSDAVAEVKKCVAYCREALNTSS